MNHTQKFITVEGIEGAGKSTIVAFLHDLLPTLGVQNVFFTREPGGTPIAESIRHLVLHAKSEEPICSEAELLLMFAARAQHIARVIKPKLYSGAWVVSDRYVDATYAYQGFGRGLSIDDIKLLDEHFVGPIVPGLTLLLDIAPDIGHARARKRAAAFDRIEQEQLSFFERVRNGYLARHNADPRRIALIDASLDQDAVQASVREVVTHYVEAHA